MKVETIIFTGDTTSHMLYTYEDGSRKVISYPPTSTVDRKLVEQFGGLPGISRATFRHGEEISKELETFQRFRESKLIISENYAINALMANVLSNEDLMKLKLTIFDHEFVKNSKNREILTSIRKSNDPVDLIMYFGMLRKEANVENKE